MDSACEMRTLPSIRLSVLKFSISILSKPYPMKYIYVICPVNFLLSFMLINIINNINVAIDSYRNVGCTSMYLPISYIPILQGKEVSVPVCFYVYEVSPSSYGLS